MSGLSMGQTTISFTVTSRKICQSPEIILKLYLSPEKMSGLSMGQTTISLTVALAKSRPAISSQATGAPWNWKQTNENIYEKS
jgi:hypothetical protein